MLVSYQRPHFGALKKNWLLIHLKTYCLALVVSFENSLWTRVWTRNLGPLNTDILMKAVMTESTSDEKQIGIQFMMFNFVSKCRI